MAEPTHIHEGAGAMRALFDNNHAIMLLVDPTDGRIEDANPAACDFYGRSRSELQKMTVLDINTSEPAEVRALMNDVSEAKRSYLQFQHRRAGGIVSDVEVYSGPVTIDGRHWLLSIIHDISDRVAAERELRDSEARLHRAEQVANLGHWVLQLETNEVRTWEGARRIYGTSDTTISLKDVQAFTLSEFRPALDKALRALIQDGERYDVEFQIRRGDDGRIVDVHSIAEYDPGARAIFGVVQDITKRKAVDRELEHYRENLEELVAERTSELEEMNAELVRATEAKSMFLASMSHELRTPLNSVIGFSGVLSQGMAGPLNDEQRRQIVMIGNAGNHLLELVSEILDLSHIESGQFTINPAPFNVCAMADRVLASFEPLVRERGLEIFTECDCNSSSWSFVSDELRVEQIMNNLVGNAVKFTDSGRVTLSIACHDSSCELRVSDTGRGIHPTEIDSVFDEYYQGHQTDVAKSRGVGLGLSLSRRLARMLGGDITVTSEPGTGSEFVLTLPKMDAERLVPRDVTG